MTARLDIAGVETAVMQDLRALGLPRLPLEAAYGKRAPGDFRLKAGFSGWFSIGPLSRVLGRDPRSANSDIRRNLGRQAGTTIRASTPLLYRLLQPHPQGSGKYQTIYIGSSKRGNVAGRLRKHFNRLPGGSRPLGLWLNPPAGPAKDPGKLFLHVGFPTHQPRPQSAIDRSINYNELFLIEKMLQREYRPLIWDPNDRPFDETPMALFADW